MNTPHNRINYNLLMEEEIAKISAQGEKPTLLLHACCAPCSSAVLERLCAHFRITVFFYNPNIAPEREFYVRLEELNGLLPAMGLDTIEIVTPPYNSEEFTAIARGLETLPEGGERCFRCYRLRLERAVRYAAEHGFSYVTTTLSVSPHKNAAVLNKLGGELAEQYGIPYLFSDFKKKNGYKRSVDLSEQYRLYRQNYCGCIYSKAIAEQKEGVTP